MYVTVTPEKAPQAKIFGAKIGFKRIFKGFFGTYLLMNTINRTVMGREGGGALYQNSFTSRLLYIQNITVSGENEKI